LRGVCGRGRLAGAICHLLRLKLHALLHVFGFAAFMLAHELVVALAFAALLFALGLACLARLFGVALDALTTRLLLALFFAVAKTLELFALFFPC